VKSSRSNVNSDDLKTLAICWLRYKKQLDLVCTEDPARNADAIGTDSSIQCRKMIEIEVKLSIADLRNDIKKESGYSLTTINNKHERLAKAKNKERHLIKIENKYGVSFGPDRDGVHGVLWSEEDHSCLPTQFYFMVTEDIKDKTLAIVNELYPHAGVMVGKPGPHGGVTEVIKTAPTLHRLLIAKGIKGQIAARMASEICRLRLDNMREKFRTAN
jgi:hypothetical protein